MFSPDFTDDITSRYEALQHQITDRLNQLQGALAASSDVEDNIDVMLRWLDEAERKTHHMVKGTLITVQREPLLDNVQEQKVGLSGVSRV